ncbi:MAG: ABC transporter ATP-binding protein [Gammaproteobacteria bacterium]|nr:ABC transporter ATP-binding protein [Gammaproteobacteria bacterium]MYF66793.1 ABC transporter ATP-binding protein [Gammaproteobacteria bacterium]MYK37323.1 ABC transporter ATP-binding protein [Gammaproteobacteria bacterium]
MTLAVDSVSLVLGDGDQQVTALNNVSLTVEAGDLCAVMGPSGAGKSSLLAVCGGLLPPTSGHIVIEGKDLTALGEGDRARLRRERIGFIFQQSNLVAALTAMDQLLLMAHINGRNPDGGHRERAARLLEEVGLAHRASHRPDQMSGGERQRVGIARALMTEPSLLLVDEPTSMLDHSRGGEVVELLARQTREHGVATLMVTHDRAMLPWADQVAEIEDGFLSPPTSPHLNGGPPDET